MTFSPVSIRIGADVGVPGSVHVFHSKKYLLRFRCVVVVTTLDDAVDEAVVQNRILRNVFELFHFTDDIFGTSHCIDVSRFCQSIYL